MFNPKIGGSPRALMAGSTGPGGGPVWKEGALKWAFILSPASLKFPSPWPACRLLIWGSNWSSPNILGWGQGGSIGHDSLLRGAPRASYSLQAGSGAPGRSHRGEAQRSPPPRRACGRWLGALRCSPEPRNLPKRASHVLRGRGASWSLVGGPMPRADGTSGYAEWRPGGRPAKTKS